MSVTGNCKISGRRKFRREMFVILKGTGLKTHLASIAHSREFIRNRGLLLILRKNFGTWMPPLKSLKHQTATAFAPCILFSQQGEVRLTDSD